MSRTYQDYHTLKSHRPTVIPECQEHIKMITH